MLAEQLPPHDLEAERAVIGSLLIDGGRFPEVAEIVGERDFYRESHALAFRAIAEVSRSGGGVDQVAVADRIRAEIQDERDRGNMRALLSVAVAETPTAVNAVHYAGIVRRCSDLRRAISLANEIAAAAYRSDADPAAIAEAVVRGGLELGRGSAGPRALRPIREHADAAFNRLSEIYERGPAEVGIPSGLSGILDHKLGGLQRGRFYVVAARTSAGKTTMLVQISLNVARRGGRVVYYSLEEASIDLLARMISVEMGVDWKRLNPIERSLRASDFHGALGRVSDLPILTTDAARLTMGDIHGQAAVIGTREPLALVVVDYLNLTDEPKLGRESRDEVIGRITRGLKRLARELDVPVIAAAQLNREVEHRSNREPLLSDLRECVAADTPLIDADTGEQVCISALRPGQRVLAVGADQRVGAAAVERAWEVGVRPTFELHTSMGRRLTATANHPLLTPLGWRSIGDLKSGDLVAVAFRMPIGIEPHVQDADRCRLLGYLAGNGTVQNGRSVGLIVPDRDAFAEAIGIVHANWPDVHVRVRDADYNDVSLTRIYANGWGKPHGNPLMEWLREIGLHGQRDSDKRVPPFVFRAGALGAREFLAGYLATDGCVTFANGRPWIRFDTVSHGLAEDTAALCARIGVLAAIGRPAWNSKSTRPIYRVTVSSAAENILRFARQVSVPGVRGALLRAAVQACVGRATRASAFNLPRELAPVLSAATGRRNQNKMVSRTACVAMAERTGDPELTMWAESDLVWARVESVKPVGDKPVWDVSIPGLNCFLTATGLAAHNSGNIEQDADAVILLYRPQYYVERGMAKAHEVRPSNFAGTDEDLKILLRANVAKNRVGPIGTVNLRYDPAAGSIGPWMGRGENDA